MFQSFWILYAWRLLGSRCCERKKRIVRQVSSFQLYHKEIHRSQKSESDSDAFDALKVHFENQNLFQHVFFPILPFCYTSWGVWNLKWFLLLGITWGWVLVCVRTVGRGLNVVRVCRVDVGCIFVYAWVFAWSKMFSVSYAFLHMMYSDREKNPKQNKQTNKQNKTSKQNKTNKQTKQKASKQIKHKQTKNSSV